MDVHHADTVKEAIDNFQKFLECDMYSKFKPNIKINGKDWTREDIIKDEKEFKRYLKTHFNILRKEIKIATHKTSKTRCDDE